MTAPARFTAMAPAIRQLSEAAINRIAAGEVVERPASAVKELVENALDAGARRIEIAIAEGGRGLIRVGDDGCGIAPEDLALALARHATSKIDGSDLLAIATLGFRGEALASLGAAGRLSVTSRRAGGEGATIACEGGRLSPVRPAAAEPGTVVDLRDLFFATPARLKFLRSDRAEAGAVAEVVRRLALAAPRVAFTLRDVTGGAERLVFAAPAEGGDDGAALRARAARILGRDFEADAVTLAAERDGHALAGLAALPTHSHGTAARQHVMVRGRPVSDRLLLGALRGAYADMLPRGRHPAAVLLIDCAPRAVDVNVHPAKSEVRFRDPAAVRALVVSGVRAALDGGRRASARVSGAVLGAARPAPPRPSAHARAASYRVQAPLGLAEGPAARYEPPAPAGAEPGPRLRTPRWAPRARIFTATGSWRRARAASSSWTGTPPTSVCSTSGSSASSLRAACPRRRC